MDSHPGSSDYREGSPVRATGSPLPVHWSGHGWRAQRTPSGAVSVRQPGDRRSLPHRWLLVVANAGRKRDLQVVPLPVGEEHRKEVEPVQRFQLTLGYVVDEGLTRAEARGPALGDQAGAGLSSARDGAPVDRSTRLVDSDLLGQGAP